MNTIFITLEIDIDEKYEDLLTKEQINKVAELASEQSVKTVSSLDYVGEAKAHIRAITGEKGE